MLGAFSRRPDWSRPQIVALGAALLVLVGAITPWADLYTLDAEPFVVAGHEVYSGFDFVPLPYGVKHADGRPNVPLADSAGLLVAALALVGAAILFLRRPMLRARLAPIPFALVAAISLYHVANIRANLAVGPDCVYARQVQIQWGLYLAAAASLVATWGASRRLRGRPAPSAQPDEVAGTVSARAAPFLVSAAPAASHIELTSLAPRRRLEERLAKAGLLVSASMALIVLAWLIGRLAMAGLPHVDTAFLECNPAFSRRAVDEAGIRSALHGSWWLAILVLAMALPVGILAGIYMNEYAKPTRLNRLLRLTIANLAGVPSVVFGILGLAIFVRPLDLGFIETGGLGFVILAGALTLSVLSLPVIIVATEEALRAVPRAIREAAYGLGATKWQVTKDHVLPNAIPGIATGSILALARAVGETAPLILVGGAAAAYFVPSGPLDHYSALPLLTYNWAKLSQAEFRELAAAATLVLLAFIVAMNLVAILLRNHFQKKLRW